MNSRRAHLVDIHVRAFYITHNLPPLSDAELQGLRDALTSESTHVIPVHGANQWTLHHLQLDFYKAHQPTLRAFAIDGTVLTALTAMLDTGVRTALQSLRFDDIEVILLVDEFEQWLFAEGEARPNELGRNFGIAVACTWFGTANHEHTLYKRQVKVRFHQLDPRGNICTAFNQITNARMDALTAELNERLRKVVEF